MLTADWRSRSDTATVIIKKLNAVEYHRSSELDIAVDDLILLLGCCTSERYEYRTDRSAEKDN